MFKNFIPIYKLSKSALLCVLFLLGTIIWTQVYLESQNFLLKNPNWYAYKSSMVDSFIIALESSMSRTIIGGRELNLRNSNNADIILNQHKTVLKDLEFIFMIPNNSYLDVIYNFKDGASSFFRLSRSSLHKTGFYSIDRKGNYTQFKKVNFTVESEQKFTGSLKQTNEGIAFFVDNKLVATNLADKFIYSEFGFESGLIGVILSDVKAWDLNSNMIGTSLDNNSDWGQSFGKIFLVGLLLLIGFIFAAYLFKKNALITVIAVTKFMFLLGTLWLFYDFFYYSKKVIDWDGKMNTTRLFQTPVDEIDFEVIRFRLFKQLAHLLGDKTIDLTDYEKRFGKHYKKPGLDFCFNSECGSLEDKKNINIISDKKTIRLGLIGLSATTSSGIKAGDDSTFLKMHEIVYKKNANDFNIESYNFSAPSLKFKAYGDKLFNDADKNNINVLILLLKIRPSTSKEELLSFEKFLKKCKSRGIKTFFVNEPTNPEKIFYMTKNQVKDIIRYDIYGHQKKNLIMYPLFDKYRQYDLTILEPNGIFFDLKNIKAGKIWWDSAHLTSYGHGLFGGWLGNQIKDKVLENKI